MSLQNAFDRHLLRVVQFGRQILNRVAPARPSPHNPSPYTATCPRAPQSESWAPPSDAGEPIQCHNLDLGAGGWGAQVLEKNTAPLPRGATFGVQSMTFLVQLLGSKVWHSRAKMSFETENFKKMFRKFWKQNRKKVEKFWTKNTFLRAPPLYWYQRSQKCVFFRKFSTFFRFFSQNFEFLTRSESRFLAKRTCLFLHKMCSIFCTKTEPGMVHFSKFKSEFGTRLTFSPLKCASCVACVLCSGQKGATQAHYTS